MRKPVFVGDFCTLASRQRIVGAVQLAERGDLESNPLWAVDNWLPSCARCRRQFSKLKYSRPFNSEVQRADFWR